MKGAPGAVPTPSRLPVEVAPKPQNHCSTKFENPISRVSAPGAFGAMADDLRDGGRRGRQRGSTLTQRPKMKKRKP